MIMYMYHNDLILTNGSRLAAELTHQVQVGIWFMNNVCSLMVNLKFKGIVTSLLE